jgi:hypothetical protein
MIICSHWPVWKASLLAGFFCVLFGGVEAALILTLKVGSNSLESGYMLIWTAFV